MAIVLLTENLMIVDFHPMHCCTSANHDLKKLILLLLKVEWFKPILGLEMKYLYQKVSDKVFWALQGLKVCLSHDLRFEKWYVFCYVNLKWATFTNFLESLYAFFGLFFFVVIWCLFEYISKKKVAV